MNALTMLTRAALDGLDDCPSDPETGNTNVRSEKREDHLCLHCRTRPRQCSFKCTQRHLAGLEAEAGDGETALEFPPPKRAQDM